MAFHCHFIDAPKILCRTELLEGEAGSFMGEKSEHLELQALYDFVTGVAGMAGMDANAHRHVEECEQCRTDAGWLRWLAAFGIREKQYDPPAWAAANAGNLFRLKKPGLVTIAKEIVASLVYDSFNEPLPLGVRQRDLPARQALYKTDSLQLDLKIEVGDEKGLIIGQIVADKSDVDIAGLQIELTDKGEVISKSRTNALGEFVFEGLPNGNYELQVVLSDTMVKLPPLHLGNS